ncbi:MAG: HAD family hydrolase [Haliea sp.]
MIRCAVLDFDGTLVASNSIKRRGFYEIAAHVPGASVILDSIFLEDEFADRHQIWRRFSQILGSANGFLSSSEQSRWAASLARNYTAWCERAIVACPETPGADAALAYLREFGCSIYINSATPKHTLVSIVSRRGLEGRVDGIFGGPKRKADNLGEIMKRTSSLAEEVVVIGDSDDDLVAAASVGCHFIGISFGPGRFSKRPSFVFDNLLHCVRKGVRLDNAGARRTSADAARGAQ